MSTVAADREIAPASKENQELKALQQQSFESTDVSNPQTLQEYINLAKVMALSGFWPDAKTAHSAVAIMILGRHWGLSPIQSLTSVHVIKGKPGLHYSAMLAKVREHPDYDYEILEETAKVARIQFTRKGKPCGISTFTIEQAKQRGTQNIDKFPEVMLIARATSSGVRKYCPDVLNGMPVYVPGEVEDDSVYVDGGQGRKDTLTAELEARAVESGAIDAEHIDKSDEVDAEEYEPEDRKGLDL